MPRRTYFVLTPSKLKGKSLKTLDVAMRTNKRHRQTKVMDVSGMSDVQLYAKVRKDQPRGILLLGGDVLQRFRPGQKITDMRGVPFMLDLRRKGEGSLTTSTFHPAATAKKPKWRDVMNDDIQMFYTRADKKGLGVFDNWPEYCVAAKCELMVDHYDYEGVPYCRGHFLGYDPITRSQQTELFAA